ncbi:ArsR family transcriptional regulator [Natronolimnobius sp. AArcel1]|uniref:ArsR family transcriptional regulator n=1 Tax=Natronolimnobius sp. AArcel1 TaxID=1679093 RepID=UPI0013EDD89C|nr:ArsR family transcriptional regulator [Natronolimnobius sp. AArcel1]NGM69864.1 ArsR family transcriptional regulator [Natronolimnobius sp. AArcel1]
MRPLVSWMTKSDPAILEFFEETGIAMPPAVVSYNIHGVSHPTVKRRLPVLVEHELLEKVDEDRGYYRVANRGRAYLSGELEADELEPEK